MKEDKADAIDAAPIQIHREMMQNEELIGAAREPYGPGGMCSMSQAVPLLTFDG